MATVRFSKELSDAILRNARGVFSAQIKQVEDSAPRDWGDRIYDIIFAQYIPAFNVLPAEFFGMHKAFKFAGFKTDDSLRFVSFDMPLVTPRPFPIDKVPASLERFIERSGYYGHEYKLQDIPEFAEFKQLVADWKAKCQSIQDRRAEFVEQVKKVIEAHATLAPALKMWQPLWDLIPTEYKDRHREIKEREKREVSLDVDLAKMTAIATAAKIGGL